MLYICRTARNKNDTERVKYIRQGFERRKIKCHPNLTVFRETIAASTKEVNDNG